LIAIRAVVSTGLLGGAAVAEILSPGVSSPNPLFLLVATTYGLTIIFALTLRFVERHRWLVDLQLVCDAAIVSAFILTTGGVASFFSSLYVLPIVAASTLQFRRGGLLVATLSAVAYTGLVLAQYTTGYGLWIDALVSDDQTLLPTVAVAEFTVALNLFGFFAVAMLSGSLAETGRLGRTRLAQAATEIADLQALNQHVIDSLPSGLVTTDRGQWILTFNHAAEAITGVSFHAAVGRPLADVLQFPPSLVAVMNEGLSGPGVRRLEFPYRRPDAVEIIVGLSATHLETPGGRAGYIVTFQDVTEVKKLDRQARIQQRLAAVGEMAAGIAHEIRNPLAAMSGSIQILRQELPLSAEQEQLMDIVLRESERLNTTIGSFLAYARPQKFMIARVDVRRAVNDTALLLRHGADVHAAHAIVVEVPPTELWLEADEGQLKQIVWNLATNGLRAMAVGGTLRLSARLAVESGDVEILVQDEGIGIPADDIDGLFQPFHGSFAKGSGLGLAIVHRIVSDYHGEIQIRSAAGVGTTVTVRLPVRVEVTA
jgi:two-component system sensor histidine kinase PilS (NtrC family)